jgi:ubiquinone/menaquinone biosynthesis C-methylase UbiE
MAESFFDDELFNEFIPKKALSATNHLQKKDVNKIKRVQGDALNLPFESKSMNVVNFSYIFYHMNEESCKKSLSEGCRVLKENGYIFIQPVYEKSKTESEEDEMILILRKKNGKIILDKYI